jgi:hypothetical protein
MEFSESRRADKGVLTGKTVTRNPQPFTDHAIASAHQQRYAALTPAI